MKLPTDDFLKNEINQMLENYQNGKFDISLNLALSILKKDPKHNLTIKILGSIYEQQDKLDESLKMYQKSLALDNNDPEAHNNLGLVLQKQGKLQEAMLSLKKAIALKPDFIIAIYNLGNTLKEIGNLEDAEINLKRCIELKPNFIEAYINLANTQSENNNFKDAERSLKKCIELKQNFIPAHYNLGNLLKKLGRLDEAMTSYNYLLKLKPSYKPALLGRGQIFFIKKKFDQALNDFDNCNTSESRARALITLYNSGNIDEIYQRINNNAKLDEKNLRVAAFSSFISHKENKETKNNFCKNPLEFLYFSNLSSHLKNSDKFIDDLIDQIKHINASWEPSNKTTIKGFQSTKNLFVDSKGKIKDLQKIIIDELQKYNLKFKDKSCLFINEWPLKKNLFGWHVILQQQGYQDPHIHPVGWLSGVIYLKVVPSLEKNEGAIEFSLNAQNYSDVKSPKFIHQPKKGDIVFFPSSLHHRTIPFTTNTDRIIISFDLLPDR
ncbi:tetratricopeptide repeat protein [Candidatus Pelagibacter bacterium]|nr:tetratricopeptide repeat protein [Candidatus Pelagibacter bacterium]